MDDNPLQLPPLAVAARGLDAIRAYFKDLEAGTAIARTCMLVLLGDAEMGKTSLLNGLRNDCTPDPAPAGPDGRTIHLDIKPLSLGAGLTLTLTLTLTRRLGGRVSVLRPGRAAQVVRGRAAGVRRERCPLPAHPQRRGRKQRCA